MADKLDPCGSSLDRRLPADLVQQPFVDSDPPLPGMRQAVFYRTRKSAEADRKPPKKPSAPGVVDKLTSKLIQLYAVPNITQIVALPPPVEVVRPKPVELVKGLIERPEFKPYEPQLKDIVRVLEDTNLNPKDRKAQLDAKVKELEKEMKAEDKAKLQDILVRSGLLLLPREGARVELPNFNEIAAKLADPPEGFNPAKAFELTAEKSAPAPEAKANPNDTRPVINADNLDFTTVKPEPPKAEPPKPKTLEEVLTPKEMDEYKALREKQSQPEYAPKPEFPPAEVERLATQYNQDHPATQQGKTLDIVLGPPGSGKSSMLVEPLQKKYGSRVVDSDWIKPTLDGYDKGYGGSAVHRRSAQIADRALLLGLEKGDNMIWPTVGSSRGNVDWLILAAKEKGYTVRLHYADIPPEVAARRVFDRSMKPDEAGNRQIVDPKYPLGLGDAPLKVFTDLIGRTELVDGYSLWDTNVPRGEKPVLKGEKNSGFPDLPTPALKPEPQPVGRP